MRNKIIFTCLATTLLTAACGDAADPAAAPTTSEKPAAITPASPVTSQPAKAEGSTELRQAVQAYSDAFLTGDATTAYGLLSERCRKRTSLSTFTGIVSAAEQMYGSALPFESYSAKESDDLARVTYTYSIKAINQEAEPWTREAGNWHQDDC
ncbi:nuclear transport factor 2 family protein [Actinoplanes solisilvae]|uniref:nuclear transport factor 2 family protein n=1 Tax=Actinoplanes solisilvae TaxID=2486853 RepID=UPI00196AF031|nr:nuclear transport factor 2 family protein [Actinoplanes solisilvae]